MPGSSSGGGSSGGSGGGGNNRFSGLSRKAQMVGPTTLDGSSSAKTIIWED